MDRIESARNKKNHRFSGMRDLKSKTPFFEENFIEAIESKFIFKIFFFEGGFYI